jgi:acetyl esterase/lipase
MANASYTPPGRLGDPNMTLATDPRTHPKIRQLVQAFPIANATEHPKEWSIESLTPGVAASEAAVSGLYEFLENDLPTDADEPKVDISEQTIKGVDGNDIKAYIYKPASAQEPLPAVLYFHGGGMVS